LDAELNLWDIPDVSGNAPTEVHPTAIVAPGAQLGQGVVIGPYCVIGPKVVIGDRSRLISHVSVENRTWVGARTVVHPFATLGGMPQDLKFAGEDSELIIGEENSIRSYVNISIGTASGGGRTIIGRRNLLMVYVHVAHDCLIGNNVVLVNGVSVAGHVTIQDRAFLGGMSGVHQFCRIGTRAMVGGGSMVVQDVPPYCLVQGDRAAPVGLNMVALRRAGFSADALRDLKAMYRLVFSENLTVEDAILQIEAVIAPSPERQVFVEFLRLSERGVCR